MRRKGPGVLLAAALLLGGCAVRERAGTLDAGEACTSSDDCRIGTTCAACAAGDGTCVEGCTTDDDCAAGSCQQVDCVACPCPGYCR